MLDICLYFISCLHAKSWLKAFVYVWVRLSIEWIISIFRRLWKSFIFAFGDDSVEPILTQSNSSFFNLQLYDWTVVIITQIKVDLKFLFNLLFVWIYHPRQILDKQNCSSAE